MILVTTHQTADFDAYAGVLAATLLHPGAVASFPGSKEPALRAYLEADPAGAVAEIRVKEVNLAAVETLVLVDTVSVDRLGPFSALAARRGGPRVVCYDHHPSHVAPIGFEVHVRPVGAVTTLLASLLRERGVGVTPPQATLMVMGIYEDTGGLLHAGTTPEDLVAVAWLLEQGADLGKVARTLSRGLSPLQVDLYHSLLHGVRNVQLRGREVVLATAATNVFVPDASVVVQQLVQGLGALRFVALMRMGDRIFLIARSGAHDFDAAKIAIAFGGGGHPSASSAVIHGKTLIEAEDALLPAIEAALVPSACALDLATPILYTVESGVTVRQAVGLLNRYRVNALPVVDGGRVTGAFTRQLADFAQHHGMDERPVGDVAVGEVEVIPPDADLDEVRRRLLSANTRFVLVGNDPSSVRGILTRTVLLRHLLEERSKESVRALQRDAQPPASAGEDLSPLLAKGLAAPGLDLLRSIGQLAADSDVHAYLVGGVVRDLLLRRENRDLDVVVEGDAGALARRLAETVGGRVRVHEAFQTAVVLLGNGLRVDFASARTEHYRGPAALPEVTPGGIRQDLFRRDFTINALAIRLTPPGFGRVLDFFGGRRDLREGKIRVLHGLSFIEDPTRAFRAVRFANRLDFQISKETAHLIRVATEERVFQRLTPVRLRRELEQILGGRHPAAGVRMLAEHRLLTCVHGKLRPNRRTYARLERAEEVLSWHRLLYRAEAVLDWTVVLGVLAEGLEPSEREEFLDRLRPNRAAARILSGQAQTVHRVLTQLTSRAALPASAVHEACRGEPAETLLLAMALTSRDAVREHLSRYLSRLRDVRPDIRGTDLIRAGVSEGPRVARGLEAALRAKLDGLAPDGPSQLRVALAAVGGID